VSWFSLPAMKTTHHRTTEKFSVTINAKQSIITALIIIVPDDGQNTTYF
jgi:hypothetical protein